MLLLYEPLCGVMLRSMLKVVVLIDDEVEDKSIRRRQLSQLNRTAEGSSKLISDSLLECLHTKQKRDNSEYTTMPVLPQVEFLDELS